ncbi:MAG: hypothetical protein HC933_12130, partial [Pleurocapsa sp. SU_196_0]|nr:hypothetical protein [Pleurocapsa sp. SU_196_0]
HDELLVDQSSARCPLIVMAVFFATVFGSFFLLMSAEEKKTPVDSFRHKVQAVPNLLRGKMGGPYHSAGNAGVGATTGATTGNAGGVAGGVEDAFKAEPPKEDHFLQRSRFGPRLGRRQSGQWQYQKEQSECTSAISTGSSRRCKCC